MNAVSPALDVNSIKQPTVESSNTLQSICNSSDAINRSPNQLASVPNQPFNPQLHLGHITATSGEERKLTPSGHRQFPIFPDGTYGDFSKIPILPPTHLLRK